MSDTYIKITEKRKSSCFSSGMVQNIPGMLRVLSKAQDMRAAHERLDVNVMVRLGAWKPILESAWETRVKQSMAGQNRDAFADINVDKNSALLSDWLIGNGRTEVTGELDKLTQCYKASLKNGKLDQERFAVNLADLCLVKTYSLTLQEQQNGNGKEAKPVSVDAYKEDFEDVELFGRPALFTNARIQRDSVPRGWFCYELRGRDDDPGAPAAIEEGVVLNHAGTVLSPTPVAIDRQKGYREIGNGLRFRSGEIGLAEFCAEHGLDFPQDSRKYVLRPASPEEAGLFYAMPKEQDEALGAIGHLRADFGRHGNDFWSTWWPRGPEELNSPEFKTEFDDLVNNLRENGPLKSLTDMRRYCREHGGEIAGGLCTQNYGYIIETEGHRYALRCNPQPGDYNAYLTAFDLRVQEMNMEQEQQNGGGMQMGGISL